MLLEQIKRLGTVDLGQEMIMSLINQKLSQGGLYLKIVIYLRKCGYNLDEFFEAHDSYRDTTSL